MFLHVRLRLVTGHSYVTHGPMLIGAAQVVFEAMPTYPDVRRLWERVASFSDVYQILFAHLSF